MTGSGSGTSWIPCGVRAVVAEAGSRPWLRGRLAGVPLAVACPDLEVVLVERRRGRAAFLELVVSEVWVSAGTSRAGRH